LGPSRAGLARGFRQRVHATPTREGVWFGLMLIGTLLAAVNTGNNLVYLALGLLCGVLVLSNALAEWNLRGLTVTRRLPSEAFAGDAAPGAYVVENRRRFGTAFAIEVSELEGAEARGVAAWVAPLTSLEVPVQFVFGSRGAVRLSRIRIASSFPFGFVRRYRDLDLEVEFLAYPAPGPGPNARSRAHHGLTRQNFRRRGHGEDFYGLRPYAPGDPLKTVHWPSSAKAGRPMVIERVAEAADEVVVEVPEIARGDRWEAALSRACGQTVRHFTWGHAVGLEIGGQLLAPGTGAEQRRRILGALARAPHRTT